MAGGEKTPVAGDGRLLRGAGRAPTADRPAERRPAAIASSTRSHARPIAALAAAPAGAARPRPARVHDQARRPHARAARRSGPALRRRRSARGQVGRGRRRAGRQNSAGATYLDLRYPERPAAGGLEDPTLQRDPEAVNSADPAADAPRRRCRRRGPRHSQPQPQLEPTERRKSQGQLQTSANCKQDCALDFALTPQECRCVPCIGRERRKSARTLDAT